MFFHFLSLADLAELAEFILLIFLPLLILIAKAIGSRRGQILRYLRNLREINYFSTISPGSFLRYDCWLKLPRQSL